MPSSSEINFSDMSAPVDPKRRASYLRGVCALFLGLAVALACSSRLRAEEASPEAVAAIQRLTPGLEAYTKLGMKEFDCPGLAIGIIAGDKLVYARGFGTRAKGDRRSVDPNTIFQIGSTTKAFLATTMAIAVDQNKFHWDDRVVDLFPEFQLKDAWVTREFRMFDLLAQRSGLPAYANDDLFQLGYGRDAMIRSLRYVEPVSSFRSTFSYTNITHLVAGRIVARAEGAPDWFSVLQKELLDPLGMNDTTYSAAAIEAAADHASGHRYQPGGTVEIPFDQLFPYAAAGAGAINSSVDQLVPWVRMLLNDGSAGGKTIVSPRNLAATWIPRVGINDHIAYANGWILQATPNGTITWHNGGTDGFGAYVGLDRDRKIGVVVLSNETNVGLPDALGLWIFDRLLGNPRVDHVATTLERVTKRFEHEARKFAKPDHPSASPPFAKLTGNFGSPVFGTAKLSQSGNALDLALAETGAHLRLEPWDGAVFTARLVAEGRFARTAEILGPQPFAFANFLAGVDGRLDTLRITFSDGQAYDLRRE